ncbi:hypothetical protein CAPN010_13390 [Capnocytophaga cynodegmi]|uniref:hypothetical protein n=1 Tax=Capnocytophaga cynodegmi TaxID=28189 RepID=UPI001EE2319C|nr:hypothetical protein [Capnocytophaga cynodegmi]GJQ07181.1 hypothetical protein CAPN010_13390 [Capnocytophaga cynodegmi]
MRNILVLCTILFSGVANAQVGEVISGFTTHLTKSDLPFSGDRKVYVVGLND